MQSVAKRSQGAHVASGSSRSRDTPSPVQTTPAGRARRQSAMCHISLAMLWFTCGTVMTHEADWRGRMLYCTRLAVLVIVSLLTTETSQAQGQEKKPVTLVSEEAQFRAQINANTSAFSAA